MLVISASLGLAGGEEKSAHIDSLTSRGWQPVDHVACALEPGTYYELEGEDTSVELIALEGGGALAARAPLPEAPYICHPIAGPHFVEEI